MSECKWTQGPWIKVTGKTYCAVRSDSGVIADMRMAGGYYNTFDADLIAAAPDLYEALDAAADALEKTANDALVGRNAAAGARAALSKARGES